MTFSLTPHPHQDAFDPEHDMDLIAAINEARTDRELDQISRMARRRFAARAQQTQHGRRGHARPGLRRALALRLAGR
jgi:hypothetical protein